MADFIQIKKTKYEVVDPGSPLFVVRDTADGEYCAIRENAQWCDAQFSFVGAWRKTFEEAVEDCQIEAEALSDHIRAGN